MSDDTRQCLTCRCFAINDGVPDLVKKDTAGQCRRNPPVVADRIIDRMAASANDEVPAAFAVQCHYEACQGVWPWVYAWDWCGEWQPSPDLAKQADSEGGR